MPHVIYLHSALTQDRIVAEDGRGRAAAAALHAHRRDHRDVDRRADQPLDARDGRGDVLGASGLPNVDSLESAHETLEPILGPASATLFAIALLASGLSSSAVGTLAGQVVMQGFVRRQIPVLVRRLVTMAPAFIVVAIGVNPARTLVISQVVLSFGIPFALVPLIMLHVTPRPDGPAREPPRHDRRRRSSSRR